MPNWGKRLLELLDFPELQVIWRWFNTPPLKCMRDIDFWHHAADRNYNAIQEYKRRNEALEFEFGKAKTKAYESAQLARQYLKIIETFREYWDKGQMNFQFDCSECGCVREPKPPELRFVNGNAGQYCALCLLEVVQPRSTPQHNNTCHWESYYARGCPA